MFQWPLKHLSPSHSFPGVITPKTLVEIFPIMFSTLSSYKWSVLKLSISNKVQWISFCKLAFSVHCFYLFCVLEIKFHEPRVSLCNPGCFELAIYPSLASNPGSFCLNLSSAVSEVCATTHPSELCVFG